MDLTYAYPTQVVVTVEDVYNPGATKPPKGFKLTGEFRPPKAGEHFLASPTGAYDWSLLDFSISSPRLILTEAPVRKQYIFTETGEERTVRAKEWYLFGGEPFRADYDGDSGAPRKILTLEVREIQEP